MAQELDLTKLTLVLEARYRHPAGSGDDLWNCPTCRTRRSLTEAALVRVREHGAGRDDEFALVICGACRSRLAPRRGRPARLGRHDVAERLARRRESHTGVG